MSLEQEKENLQGTFIYYMLCASAAQLLIMTKKTLLKKEDVGYKKNTAPWMEQWEKILGYTMPAVFFINIIDKEDVEPNNMADLMWHLYRRESCENIQAI